MNIGKLKSILRDADFSRNNSVKLEFIEKRKNGYTSYVIQLENPTRKSIIDMYHNTFNQTVFGYNQVAYNPLGIEEGTIEVTTTNLAKISEITSLLGSPENRVHDLSSLNLDKINYYRVHIQSDEDSFQIFRRFNKLKKLRKGVQGYITGNSFNKIESDMVGLDNQADIVIKGERVLIVSRYALEVIFDLSDYFVEKTKEAMNLLDEEKIIENFNTFREDCLNDGRDIKRVTKIVNTPSLIKDFSEKISVLPEVVEEAKLSINFNANGKIDYQGDRTERSHILSCMADKYYRTLLQQKIGEDKLK